MSATKYTNSKTYYIKTIKYDFLLRFRIIISKNPASQDKISLDDKFWSGTVIDFPDENNNLYLCVARLGFSERI